MANNIKKIKVVREETIFLPDRDAGIAGIAYGKAEQRGFEPGYDMVDWLEAEQEYNLLCQ